MPSDISRDILHDAARVTAILDIRQMMGPDAKAQNEITEILIDHNLERKRNGSGKSEDYLIPK